MLSALPILFLLLCKGAYGNIRDRPAVFRGQSRAPEALVRRLLCLLKGKIDIYKKIRKLKIRPEGGEK